MIKVVYFNNVVSNNFKSLGDIKNKDNVKRLYCSNYGLTLISKNISNMFPNLEYLNLDHNCITHISDNTFFPKLKKLIICNNKLISLPDTMGLIFPNLEYLNCSYNNIKTISKYIFMRNLSLFDANYNLITSLPEKFSEMFPNLEKLYLSWNYLKLLPYLVFTKLKHIKISNNCLTALPYMNMSKLEVMNFNFNNISLLPKLSFPNLEKCWFYNNSIIMLPEIDCPKLELFDCAYNKIKKFPKKDRLQMLSLTNLWCNFNYLESIPDYIYEIFPKLKYFNCSNNEITIINNFKTLLTLKEFYYTDNKISDDLPKSLIDPIPLIYNGKTINNTCSNNICPQKITIIRRKQK
jgi:Leucine-rich repeat (LRR) protein